MRNPPGDAHNAEASQTAKLGPLRSQPLSYTIRENEHSPRPLQIILPA